MTDYSTTLSYQVLGCAMQLEKVHFKQLMTYLKITDKPIGYLINFNTENFSIGHSIHKIINHSYGKEIPAWLG